MPWGLRGRKNIMSLDNTKSRKKDHDYKQKSIYFDRTDEYQDECLYLLSLCGHKQARFLSLLAHDYIQRSGIAIDYLDKDNFGALLTVLELQSKSVASSQSIPSNVISFKSQVEKDARIRSLEDDKAERISKKVKKIATDDEFIKEEDMDDMNAALAAFGI